MSLNTPYLIHTTLAETPPAEVWEPKLPAAWRERLGRMRSEAARRRSLAGLWLLREAAAMAGLPEAVLAELSQDSNGRPILPGGPSFNVSHCDLRAACAVTADTAVGLDLEWVRPIDVRRFARFLGVGEVAAAERDPAVFFNAWTAREAAVKAGGRVGLARIARVRVNGDRAELDGETLYLQWPVVTDGLTACLASPEPLAPATVREIPPPPI